MQHGTTERLHASGILDEILTLYSVTQDVTILYGVHVARHEDLLCWFANISDFPSKFCKPSEVLHTTKLFLGGQLLPE